jgi:hypothetical protein
MAKVISASYHPVPTGAGRPFVSGALAKYTESHWH